MGCGDAFQEKMCAVNVEATRTMARNGVPTEALQKLGEIYVEAVGRLDTETRNLEKRIKYSDQLFIADLWSLVKEAQMDVHIFNEAVEAKCRIDGVKRQEHEQLKKIH